jgi:hypothetical protein
MQANPKLGEVLKGLKHCFNELQEAYPETIIVDNCCHVCAEISSVFPDADIALDVWHFMKQ